MSNLTHLINIVNILFSHYYTFIDYVSHFNKQNISPEDITANKMC